MIINRIIINRFLRFRFFISFKLTTLIYISAVSISLAARIPTRYTQIREHYPSTKNHRVPGYFEVAEYFY